MAYSKQPLSVNFRKSDKFSDFVVRYDRTVDLPTIKKMKIYLSEPPTTDVHHWTAINLEEVFDAVLQ